MQPPKLPRSIFFWVFPFFFFFFLAFSEQNNGYFNNFDFVQYSSVSQKFYLAFLQFDSSGQNRFLIDKRNFLSIMDNTGLIDKKSKKSIFPPSLLYGNY